MKTITLLPASYRQKIAHRKKMAKVIFGLEVVLVAVAVFCFVAGSATSALKAKQASTTQDIQALEAEVHAYDEAVAMSERLDQQLDLQAAAHSDVPLLDELMVTVANSAPPYIGISSMAMAYENQEGAGVISGTASDHSDVSAWIDILQEMPSVDNIRCSYTQQSTQDDGIVTFELQFLVLGNA